MSFSERLNFLLLLGHQGVLRNESNDVIELVNTKMIDHCCQKVENNIQLECLLLFLPFSKEEISLKIAKDVLNKDFLKFLVVLCLEMLEERKINLNAIGDILHVFLLGQNVNMQVLLGILHQGSNIRFIKDIVGSLVENAAH